MPCRFKVDEDLPLDVAVAFRTAGFDAWTVLEQKLQGTADASLWDIVQREGRWLLTADKGFADIRSHAPGTHTGLVLFRLPRESRAGYARLAELALRGFDFEQNPGAIVIVQPDSIRVYRPLGETNEGSEA